MHEWKRVRLGEVADEVTVGHVGPMVDEYHLSGVPFLRSQNVLPHRIDLSDIKFIDRDFHSKLKKSALRPGDVVTVRTGKPGTTAVVPDSLAEANCSDLVITRPGPALDAQWLSYYVNVAASDYVSAHLVGAVQQHFNVGAAKNMVLHLPPLNEQQAIAEVLGALDYKIAANTELATTADGLAGLVFDHAVDGAPYKAMSSTLMPVLGGTPARARSEYWGGDRLWASAKDITGAPFGVVIATQECITAEAVSQTKAKPLPKGSVILTARGTVGAVARLGSPSSLNQSCYGFVPDVLPAGVLYFSILRATDRAKAFAHGSVFDTITTRTFDHLEVVDMPASELRRVEGRVGPLLAKVEQSVRENESLAAMRDALLPLLMSGKIRVRDAEQMVGMWSE